MIILSVHLIIRQRLIYQRLYNGAISHDKVTRFLSEEELDSKQLWLLTKPVVRQHERDDAVLIFDDTIEEKPHTKESELICWHHDHTKNRSEFWGSGL